MSNGAKEFEIEIPVGQLETLRADFEEDLKNNVTNINADHLLAKREHDQSKYRSLYTEYSFRAWVRSWRKYWSELA